MDIIIPTNYRPHRLITTLSSLFLQDLSGQNRLVIIDNSGEDIFKIKQIQKLITAFRTKGYTVETLYSTYRSISKIKKEALEKATHSTIALLDNDLLFTRADTLSALEHVLNSYEIAGVSPLGYELDHEKKVLNEYSHKYDEIEYDENGVGEGNIALGFFLMLNKDEVNKNIEYWCDDLPYMEDQILVHFLKKSKGYAYLRGHIVYHIAYDENPSYIFNEEDVVSYLEKKGPRYQDLLDLRKYGKDGAEFNKQIKRKAHA